MKLLKSQLNQIFDYIVDQGINPSNFAFNNESEITVIHIKETDFFLSLEKSSSDSVLIRYSPGGLSLEYSKYRKAEWTLILDVVKLWIDFLKPEPLQPDKWQHFYSTAQNMNLTFNDNNSSDNFNYQEIKEIENSINKIKEEVKKLDLTEDQLYKINQKLDYLVSKSKENKKVDWKNILIGTLVSIPINLALTPEDSQKFLAICNEAFQKVLLLIF